MTQRAAALGLAACALCWLGGAAAALADDVADFYRGKRIQMVIGFDVGGGYDVYARLIARHMGRHIPGQPMLLPQNMPGAGSRVAANWLYNVAPKDGTAIATIGQGTPFDQAMGEPGLQLDSARLAWLGNPIVDNLVTVAARTAAVATLAELRTKGGLVCGDVGAGPTSTFPNALNRLLGLRNRIVPGYPGVNAVYLAMERGEVDCIGGTTWSSLKSTRAAKLRDRELAVLVQWGTAADPEISAYAGREVPLIADIATSALDRKALLFISSSAALGRPLAAPPGVPAPRIAALRQAFDATMADAAFRAEAEKAGMDIKPLAGAALQELVATVVTAPPAEVQRARELIAPAGR